MSLTIENLKVVLQKEEILHLINWEIKEGEFVSLLGASGCGKTTLLKSIAGLLEVEEGDIKLHGKSIINMPPEQRGTVIVFQDLRLFPHMTVEKNIMFPMELKKIPKSEQCETVKQLLEAVQLSGFEKRKIKEMSGGQMQRVALARALAANPKLLLLDEPFSGLDERLRGEMGKLVKKLHQEWKITTVLVTHDKREALQMSDRIVLMQEGELLQYDTPETIFYHPVSKDVANYFGKTNYIKGTVSKGIFRSGCIQCPAEQEDGVYEAMIRPFTLKPEAKGEGSRISEITFLGELAEVTLETPDGSIVSQILSGGLKQRNLCVGASVGVKVTNPETVCFF